MINKIVIPFLFICTLSFGQIEKVQRLQHFDRSKVRYGFYVGLHQRGYSVINRDNSIANVTNGYGFQLGVLADYFLTKNISILMEPGVLSSSCLLTFDGHEAKLDNTYFTFPVSLKLTTDRINNIRIYGTGGLSVNYNFKADENINDDEYDFGLKKTTLAAEISLGCNIFLPYFKLSPAIKGIYGLTSEFSNENLGSSSQTYGPRDIRVRAILFSLTFQ